MAAAHAGQVLDQVKEDLANATNVGREDLEHLLVSDRTMSSEPSRPAS